MNESAHPEPDNNHDPSASSHNDVVSLIASRISDPLTAAVVGSILDRGDRRSSYEEEHDSSREVDLLRGRVRRLEGALASADSMALYVAQTFGACRACWGLNRFCTECHGDGRPGSSDPDRDSLLSWVSPAIERLGLEVVTRGSMTTERPSD
jgi:hypothetical protein